MTTSELAALLEQIPMPAMVMLGARILGANARMSELTGWAREELLGEDNPMSRFVAEEDQRRVFAQRQARLRGEPAPDEFELTGAGAGGRRIPARVRVADFPAVGPGAALFLFSDDQVRARSATLIRGFVEVAVAAQKERTRDAFFRAVRERLLGLGLTSTVMEVEGDRFRVAPFAPALTKAGEEMRERLGGWTPLSQVPMDFAQAEGALIDDLPGFFAALNRVAPGLYLGRIPKRAVVAAIRLGGEPRYVLSASGDELDSAVAGAFGLLGRQLGAALETTLRLEELDRRNAELTLLLDLGQEVVAALDVPQVLELAVRAATRSLRCSCAYLFLPDPGGTALRVAASDDPEPPAGLRAGHPLPLDEPSLSALAYRTQRAQLSQDNRTDPRVATAVSHLFGCRSTLAVPLISHGRAVGVLTAFERSGRLFDAQDLRLATHAAQLISPALENARLYAEQRGRAEEMARLNAELAHAQKERVDRERLAALGELSASIAHEVRNPLGVIFNAVGSLRRLLKPAGDVALLIDIVGEEADRLNRMVGDLLDYSRPVRPALEPLPLRPLLQEALQYARQQVGPAAEGVRDALAVDAGAETLRADGRLLRQALVNLFLNAYQAMPRGGTLSVRAAPLQHEGTAQAAIVIQDTGGGVPAEARQKIFQPFFTTKAMGTGLGLAVVRRIVEGHGGTIELASAGSGAEFVLRLPLDGGSR